MLKEGTKFYEVYWNADGMPKVNEYNIVKHHFHTCADQYGKISVCGTVETATADVTNLVSGDVFKDNFVCINTCKKIKELFKKKLYEHVDNNFYNGRFYRDKAYAIEYYNSLIDRQIEALVERKL